MPRKPRPLKKKVHTYEGPGGGVPCPRCGSPSRVLRTNLGQRVVSAKRDHVLRERRCISPARHKFITEERSR